MPFSKVRPEPPTQTSLIPFALPHTTSHAVIACSDRISDHLYSFNDIGLSKSKVSKSDLAHTFMANIQKQPTTTMAIIPIIPTYEIKDKAEKRTTSNINNSRSAVVD
jgi:hypothetical protein